MTMEIQLSSTFVVFPFDILFSIILYVLVFALEISPFATGPIAQVKVPSLAYILETQLLDANGTLHTA